jgi:hypothetical protein
MFAILAAIAFGVALVLHLVGGSASAHWVDFTLAGLVCVALHMAFGSVITIRRTGPPA